MHRLQALCEQDPKATILITNGIGAFDLECCMRQFYGTPSRYLWEDEDGVTPNVDQGAASGIVGSPASFGEG